MSIIVPLFFCLYLSRFGSLMHVNEQRYQRKEIATNGEAEDDSSIDNIIKFNEISLRAELKVEKNEDTPDKFLLHEDARVLKKLSEGDLLLDKKDEELLSESMNPSQTKENLSAKRSMIPYARKLWISRVVPYEIQHSGTQRYSSDQVRYEIERCLRIIAEKSCIKFRRRISSDNNWLHFFKGSGCYSSIGRRYWKKEPTKISLGDFCVDPGIIIHEVFHSLGFFHEQSRPDRDSFVTIDWQNIASSMANNFDRHLSYDATIQDTLYDYKSIMHYGNTAFTVNGKPTIWAKFDKNQVLGGRRLTENDVKELNKMYECKKNVAAIQKDPWSSWSPWTPDCFDAYKMGCVRIRQRYCLSENIKNCVQADKYGVEDHYQTCPPKNCTIELLQPHWGVWASYSKCSKNCNYGMQERSRICNNPGPKYGRVCRGHLTQTSLCRVRKCKKNYYDNDFENGFGIWRQDHVERLSWKLRRGPTPNQLSGPQEDHTTGQGKYAYLHATDPFTESKQVGRLISTQIPAKSGPKCVTFYYQMNGKSIGYLDFFSKIFGKPIWHTFWSKTGHNGNYWDRGTFTIPWKDEAYELVIEGKTGIPPYSDIAIDDVQIDEGKCPEGSEGCYDHHTECENWRLHGECYKNYKWMLRSCCSTCSGMAECNYKYNEKNCNYWASVNECLKNWKWMWRNCCKACKGCLDKYPSCKYWAGIGECKKNPVWMKENCKTSCGVCKA